MLIFVTDLPESLQNTHRAINMRSNLQVLLTFLNTCVQNCEELSPKKTKRGRPLRYSQAAFVLFFVLMMYKRIHQFKTMERYAQKYYAWFGFPKAPSRKTIRERFKKLPTILHYLMPQIARQCIGLKGFPNMFRFNCSFVDKSVFKALGGIWHKKHRAEGVIPHASIDTAASWGYSPAYRWRFGYGLTVVCNIYRFPLCAVVQTASEKDTRCLYKLLKNVANCIGVLVGDKGYRCLKVIKKLYDDLDILLQTNKAYKAGKTGFKALYNDLINCAVAKWTYRSRQGAIEPVFALIRELFDLKKDKSVPYKGLELVTPYLLVTVVAVQLLMYLNSHYNKDLGNTDIFLHNFR